MPQISFFFGIAIYMYYKQKEHNPPHVHAYYSGYNATIVIETGEILEGAFPAVQLRLVREWIALHRVELAQMWKTQQFAKLPPLV